MVSVYSAISSLQLLVLLRLRLRLQLLLLTCPALPCARCPRRFDLFRLPHLPHDFLQRQVHTSLPFDFGTDGFCEGRSCKGRKRRGGRGAKSRVSLATRRAASPWVVQVQATSPLIASKINKFTAGMAPTEYILRSI